MKTSNVLLSVIAVVVFVLYLPASEGAITCADVIKDMKPCIKYLVNGGSAPPADCCAGVSKLASAATSSVDKKSACSCLKSTAQKLNPNDAAAKALPGSCGISLPFTVSANVDCSKIG